MADRLRLGKDSLGSTSVISVDDRRMEGDTGLEVYRDKLIGVEGVTNVSSGEVDAGETGNGNSSGGINLIGKVNDPSSSG